MRNVTKRIFLRALECPTLGWMMRSDTVSDKVLPPTLSQTLRIEEGIEIHKRARTLYPDGLLIDNQDMTSAFEKTAHLMNDPNVSVIFEGSFLSDRLAARADILKREDDGWHLIEVKSSVNDKKEFIDDISYTALVLSRCNYEISAASLLLLNKNYRLGMPDKDLFVEVDHTQDVSTRVKQFEPSWQCIEEITRNPSMPESSLRYECKKCELFRTCVAEKIDNHIFDLPRLSKQKFQELVTRNIVCIEDIPPDISLTAPQDRVKKCVQGNCISVGDGLKKELDSIQWPAFYLDFETLMTAIPLYPDTAPFTQIPTQYSIHVYSKRFDFVRHSEYLADPERDCRRELAEKLLKDLNGKGSILGYSAFEQRIIKELAGMFVDLREELESLLRRVIDLEKIIKTYLYHPDFHGKTSIKVVLPVLDPGMSYSGLKIKDGDTAMAAFACMVLGRCDAHEMKKIRKNLLEYCKQDSQAMVILHKKILGMI